MGYKSTICSAVALCLALGLAYKSKQAKLASICKQIGEVYGHQIFDLHVLLFALPLPKGVRLQIEDLIAKGFAKLCFALRRLQIFDLLATLHRR